MAAVKKTGRNVRTCVKIGLGIGVLFSLYVVVAYAVTAGSILDGYGTTLPVVLATYLGGGIVGGAIVGALLPLGRRWYGAMLVGSIGLMPFYAMIEFAMFPAGRRSIYMLSTLLVAATVGSLAGLGVWFQLRRSGSI